MEFKHPYIPITHETEQEMLRSIGCQSIEELFRDIPAQFRLKRELNLPASHSEFEVMQRLHELAQKNRPANNGRVFLGAGAGLHHIPAIVPALAGRSEYVTAYTSYQAEISQGMLQTLFEYQSLMAELLEIDVVNSSMYDMGSALGEAGRMAVRVTKRPRILVPGTINPLHYQVLKTYTEPAGIQLEKISFDLRSGLMDLDDLRQKMNTSVAGVYVENPTYFGTFETQVDEINQIVHDAGALFIVGVDILSLGIVRPPGQYGADIVIGEGQPLGNPVSYGGPMLGVFGCSSDRRLLYQMPGRLVGMTTTVTEPYERGFLLTLSPREQHIRREKATSNICSNEALMAVTAAIYISTLGANGLRQLATTIAHKSNYAARLLGNIPGVKSPAIGGPIWKDFVVTLTNGTTTDAVHKGLLSHDLHGGTDITNDFPELGESMLFSVTEVHSKSTIDEMVSVVREIVTGGVR